MYVTLFPCNKCAKLIICFWLQRCMVFVSVPQQARNGWIKTTDIQTGWNQMQVKFLSSIGFNLNLSIQCPLMYICYFTVM